MKNKKLVKILTISLILIFLINSGSAFASEYYTNLPESEVEDIFNLNIRESISDVLTWIIDKETYIMVEKKTDGSYVYWFNTPNTQTILYNYIDGLLPTGYIGSGIDPWQIAVDKNYSELMQEDNYTTAQKKYGFNLPSPAYIGEYPRITMSLMGVVIESNPIKFFAKKIGGLIFGGSVISPPDDKTLSTLSYVSPNDYSNYNNSFEKWIELYWDQTMEAMQDNQVLLDKKMVDKKGFDDAGKQWIKMNIMDGESSGGVKVPQTVGNIKGENTPRDISLKLQENCGINYFTVVKNIILFGIENGAQSFDSTPQRIMPYQRDTLRSFDKTSLVPDPRSEYVTELFGLADLQINFNLFSIVLNKLRGIVLSFSGTITKWTLMLNKVTNFSLIDPDSEDMKINVMMLWQSSLSVLFIMICLILLVLLTLKGIIDNVKGKQSILQISIKFVSGLILTSFLFFLSTQPASFISSVKNFGNLFFNMGTQTVMSNSFTSNFIKEGASAEDKIDCAYWISYFSIWSKYQTGVDMTSNSNKILLSNINNEPEQQENPLYGASNDQANYIKDSDFNGLWSLILAESFTEGSKINNNAYRVVDHFLAPRINYERIDQKGDGVEPILSSTTNKNYERKLQSYIDLGTFLFIILIFLAVLIKLVLFLEFIYELVMLQIHLALSSINPKMIKRTFKEFGVSLLRVGLWDIVIAIIIFMSININGLLMSLLFISFIVYVFIKFINTLNNTNSIWKPKIISAGTNFIRSRKGR